MTKRRSLKVVPDRLDLRDRPYQPSVTKPPPPRLDTLRTLEKAHRRILDQQQTSACTGFGLAAVVQILLHRAGRTDETPVSPFMLYSMARRYDEFPGAPSEDAGSSVRGALKGWYKHGVCALKHWQHDTMPAKPKSAADDWWLEAARRPLGAYYRVDTRSVTDMHVALSEVGVLYASAFCHGGWDEGFLEKVPRDWVIPRRSLREDDGGHAFAIVGYNATGFIVLNSWGREWGTGGTAVLSYEDWLEHAMDCWVAQLGVVTTQHREIAAAASLRMPEKGKVSLAADPVLRNRELSPFIVDMDHSGKLSRTGEFRTSKDDIRYLVTDHLDEFRQQWGLSKTAPIDIAIYAHGGLTGERAAAGAAGKWIPALYAARIFPIFVMWETDLWPTLQSHCGPLAAALSEQRPDNGLRDQLSRNLDARIERALIEPGTWLWSEIKRSAEAISVTADEAHAATITDEGGPGCARLLYDVISQHLNLDAIRWHLVGHSAGALLHCRLIDQLATNGWRFHSVTFTAPAVSIGMFEQTILPRIRDRRVHCYNQLHLNEETELRDGSCPIDGYERSLLYLVSHSFEGGVKTPILGMQKYFDVAAPRWKKKVPGRIESWTAPSAQSGATTHDAFETDAATVTTVIERIRDAASFKATAPAGGRRGAAAGNHAPARRISETRRARASS